jgi:hypothetical protein
MLELVIGERAICLPQEWTPFLPIDHLRLKPSFLSWLVALETKRRGYFHLPSIQGGDANVVGASCFRPFENHFSVWPRLVLGNDKRVNQILSKCREQHGALRTQGLNLIVRAFEQRCHLQNIGKTMHK